MREENPQPSSLSKMRRGERESKGGREKRREEGREGLREEYSQVSYLSKVRKAGTEGGRKEGMEQGE